MDGRIWSTGKIKPVMGTESTQRKPCPGVNLSNTNPTWTGMELNPGLRGERQATDRLNNGTVGCIAKILYRFLSSLTHTGQVVLRETVWRHIELYQHCLSAGMLSCINTACLKTCWAVLTQHVWRHVKLYQHCLSEGMLSCINTARLKTCWAVSTLPVWRHVELYQHCMSEGMLSCINTTCLKTCWAVSTLPVCRHVELYQHCLSEDMLSCINTTCLKAC